jgi:hypothetical protein
MLSFLNISNTYGRKYCPLQISTTHGVRLPAFDANRVRELEHAESVRLRSEVLSTFSFSASSDDDGSTNILLQPAGPERVTVTKNAAVSDISVTNNAVTHLSSQIVNSIGIPSVVEADKSNVLNERDDRSLPLSLAVVPTTATLNVAPTRIKLMRPPMESTFKEPPGAVTYVTTMRKSPTRSPHKKKPKNKKAQQKRTKAAQVNDGPAQVNNDLMPAETLNVSESIRIPAVAWVNRQKAANITKPSELGEDLDQEEESN